ncbi:serine proteinase stubble [Amyelois transitella]|uniref:serine proteinase stubble n=1 Tax=Amyelois transitella TaxID=680683 RepID=UPI0029900CB7|nr:serine proteinase stubble [Amyelois transitella]
MGPPISTWPYSQPIVVKCGDSVSGANIHKKCLLVQCVDNFRLVCLNFTFAVLVFQVLLIFNYVTAGPVILNMDYMQGPVPIARNIRHLPCISRRTGQEGLCMFAIDCLKANGSHLGTCIDRFYFGSCCQIPDKTILPQIIGNNVEDNTIDSGSFVHPQTEDKVQTTVTKIPDIFPTRKVTTERNNEKTTVADKVQDRTESDDVNTTIDDKDDVKLTTGAIIETTTKAQVTKPQLSTEVPLKLSTFQSVSGGVSNSVTEETKTTESQKVTSSTTTVRPTRRPTKPTYKPFRPTNFTRPQYISTTPKPRPTKPVLVFNITRKPPYRPPPKRPTTKKPLPSPPRLNITILPQSTSSRPIFTRPSVASITYINTTLTEDTTTSSTTTPSTTIPTTLSTEKITEPSTTTTTLTTTTTTTPSTTTTSTTTTTTNTTTTEKTVPTEVVTEIIERITTEFSSEATKLTTAQEVTEKATTLAIVTEKATLRPATEADSSTSPSLSSSSSPSSPTTLSSSTVVSTEYPPLVTWSTIDGATKAPENASTSSDEIWSPITPPEGWVLISTIPPKLESTSQSTTSPTTTTTTTTTPTTTPTTTTTTTTEAPTTTAEVIPTKAETVPTFAETITTVGETVATTQESELTTVPVSPETTTTEKTTSKSTTTEKTETTQAMIEFTVNVTLSPTAPTLTSTMATTNATEEQNTTTDVTTVVAETSTLDPMDSEIFSNETSAANYGKDDYKKVCGRRFWLGARIVGGSKSGFGQWPWQISLRQYRTSTYLHKCGAALLNENWAITAAHCVEHVPPSELLVRLGEHDLANEDEPYGYAERRVQIIASHPHFDPATFEYDLALLRFYEPVKFQPNIIPICIPDDDDYYVGKTAYVTGWGRLYDEGPLPSVLQEVQVPVINNSDCEAMYQAAGYNEHIPNIFICAGRQKGGADSCEGDSGGPMVIQRSRDNRFVLSGVISWGIGCAEPNQPGVYTRISEFKDWINQILMF